MVGVLAFDVLECLDEFGQIGDSRRTTVESILDDFCVNPVVGVFSTYKDKHLLDENELHLLDAVSGFFMGLQALKEVKIDYLHVPDNSFPDYLNALRDLRRFVPSVVDLPTQLHNGYCVVHAVRSRHEHDGSRREVLHSFAHHANEFFNRRQRQVYEAISE